MESLFKDVKKRGWIDSRHWEPFYKEYQDDILAKIRYFCYSRFFSEKSTVEIKKVFSHLKGEEVEGPISGEILDAVVSTRDEVLFKAPQIVEGYIAYRERKQDPKSFDQYLWQRVRWTFSGVMNPGDSPKKLLDKIVDSVKRKTKVKHITTAKDRFFKLVKGSVKKAYPQHPQVHKNIRNISDYFFEEFILDQYPNIRKSPDFKKYLTGKSSEGTPIDYLIEAFIKSKLPLEPECQNYQSKIPWKPIIVGSLGEEDEEYEDKSETSQPEPEVEELVDKYWDDLIRCRPGDPTQIKEAFQNLKAELIEPDEETSSYISSSEKFWILLSEIKQEAGQAGRRDLRVELCFWATKAEARWKEKEVKLQDLNPENISLNKVWGQGFRKKELAEEIFGQFNPNGKSQLKEKINEKRRNKEFEWG